MLTTEVQFCLPISEAVLSLSDTLPYRRLRDKWNPFKHRVMIIIVKNAVQAVENIYIALLYQMREYSIVLEVVSAIVKQLVFHYLLVQDVITMEPWWKFVSFFFSVFFFVSFFDKKDVSSTRSSVTSHFPWSNFVQNTLLDISPFFTAYGNVLNAVSCVLYTS